MDRHARSADGASAGSHRLLPGSHRQPHLALAPRMGGPTPEVDRALRSIRHGTQENLGKAERLSGVKVRRNPRPRVPAGARTVLPAGPRAAAPLDGGRREGPRAFRQRDAIRKTHDHRTPSPGRRVPVTPPALRARSLARLEAGVVPGAPTSGPCAIAAEKRPKLRRVVPDRHAARVVELAHPRGRRLGTPRDQSGSTNQDALTDLM